MSQITQEAAAEMLRKVLDQHLRVEAVCNFPSGTHCRLSGFIRHVTADLEVTLTSDGSPLPADGSTLSLRLSGFLCDYGEIRDSDAVIFTGFRYGTSVLLFTSPDRKETLSLYFHW